MAVSVERGISDGEVLDAGRLVVDHRLSVPVEVARQSGKPVVFLRVEFIILVFAVFDDAFFECRSRAEFSLLGSVCDESIVQVASLQAGVAVALVAEILFRPRQELLRHLLPQATYLDAFGRTLHIAVPQIDLHASGQ